MPGKYPIKFAVGKRGCNGYRHRLGDCFRREEQPGRRALQIGVSQRGGDTRGQCGRHRMRQGDEILSRIIARWQGNPPHRGPQRETGQGGGDHIFTRQQAIECIQTICIGSSTDARAERHGNIGLGQITGVGTRDPRAPAMGAE